MSGAGLPALESLIGDALSARNRAYAPYSKFLVGAALLGRSGHVYSGCNVENASYGLCICAERTAIASAVAAGERDFAGLVVATSSSPPTPPCGMCRQTIAEFAADLPILLVNEAGEQSRTTLSAIFPQAFSRSFLDR